MPIGFGPGSNMIRTVNSQRSAMKKRSLKESSEASPLRESTDVSLNFKKKATPEELALIREKLQREKNEIL